jgi:hypothetical protein
VSAPALRYFVGLDLGQMSDFTALAVLERPLLASGAASKARRPAYSVRYLKRWPLGTSYPEVARDVLRLLEVPPLPGCALVVDETGVGRPVVELLAEGLVGADCWLWPVSITAGSAVTWEKDGSCHVAKLRLVSVLQALLQSDRLRIAAALPEATELGTFSVKITAAGNETYAAWRERDHDDLVLAVALAAWLGEQALAVEGNEDDEPVVYRA